MKRGKVCYALVEPVAKTQYPPLGLLKIASMLKSFEPGAEIIQITGVEPPKNIPYPQKIYVSTLFTWDLNEVVLSIRNLRAQFPKAEILVGGVAASLLPEYIEQRTGIAPHVGLYEPAEGFVPDYSFTFGRKLRSSISYTSRGCVRRCKFCSVNIIEPTFEARSGWMDDINPDFPLITFWDNNWLASPNVDNDIKLLAKIGKKVDFNQGLDARLFTNKIASKLEAIDLDPIRFAFDAAGYERSVMKAIELAKKKSRKEICVYTLYNFKDTPDDLFYRLDLLNQSKALAFPMEYRPATPEKRKLPNKHWDSALLRAMKLALMFYYRRGMVTESRSSFVNIFGKTPSEFKAKLYEIYEYDKSLKRKPKKLAIA